MIGEQYVLERRFTTLHSHWRERVRERDLEQDQRKSFYDPLVWSPQYNVAQCSADGPYPSEWVDCPCRGGSETKGDQERRSILTRDLGLLFLPIEGWFCFGSSAVGLVQLYCSSYSPLHRVVSPCYWDGRYSFSSAAAAQRIRSSCGLPPASFSFPLRSGRYDERPQSRYETNLLSPLKLNYNPLSIHIHTLLGSLVLVVGILLKIQTCVCFHNSFLPFPQCSNAKIEFTFLRKFTSGAKPKTKTRKTPNM